jgi:hypothetical protein
MQMEFLKSFFYKVGVIIIVLLFIIISTAIVISLGYLFSLVFKLTLFQSSLLCIGSAFMFVFLIFTFLTLLYLNKKEDDDYYDDEEYEDDFFDEDENYYEEEDKKRDKNPKFMDLNKVGRNDPCPCGSGKKYKNCCGKV